MRDRFPIEWAVVMLALVVVLPEPYRLPSVMFLVGSQAVFFLTKKLAAYLFASRQREEFEFKARERRLSESVARLEREKQTQNWQDN